MAFLNLKAEMAKRNVTIKAVSELLEIHRNSVANKLEGESNFFIDEAVKIRDAFFPTMDIEYLFGKETA